MRIRIEKTSWVEHSLHTEHRTDKVSFADFLAARYLSARGCESPTPGQWEVARMMSTPADRERPTMRDQLPKLNTAEKLASRAHRYLTMSTEYSERERLAKRKAAGDDVYTYERWLRSFMKPADVKAALAKHRATGWAYFREERPPCAHPKLTKYERPHGDGANMRTHFCGQCGERFNVPKQAAA